MERMRDKQTRHTLAVTISQKMGLPISMARQFVDVTLARMSDGLIEDEILKLSGFGTFRVRSKRERLGRNPKTNEAAVVCARKTVYFKQA